MERVNRSLAVWDRACTPTRARAAHHPHLHPAAHPNGL